MCFQTKSITLRVIYDSNYDGNKLDWHLAKRGCFYGKWFCPAQNYTFKVFFS